MRDGADDMSAPYMSLYQEQRRNRNGLSVEDGGHHFAAAPLYLFLVVGKALAARAHIVHDDDSFSLDVACNIVVSFKDAFAALALVQALAFTVQSHGKILIRKTVIDDTFFG